jgi:hypothetical protein
VEIKTDIVAMPLIEETTGFGFALVCPAKRCDHCVNVAPVARNVSRHGRNETATLATPLHYRLGFGIDNNIVPLQFPWIKSSEILRVRIRYLWKKALSIKLFVQNICNGKQRGCSQNTRHLN